MTDRKEALNALFKDNNLFHMCGGSKPSQSQMEMLWSVFNQHRETIRAALTEPEAPTLYGIDIFKLSVKISDGVFDRIKHDKNCMASMSRYDASKFVEETLIRAAESVQKTDVECVTEKEFTTRLAHAGYGAEDGPFIWDAFKKAFPNGGKIVADKEGGK